MSEIAVDRGRPYRDAHRHARARLAAFLVPILLVLAPAATAQVNNQCDTPGEVPDVIVHIYEGAVNFGSVGGITAFAIGSETCNVGTCWLNFFGSNPNHPALGQNMFRLKNGRFEQIGQSWVKHPSGALQDPGCSSNCLPAPDGTHLGVLCSDIYNGFVNGYGPWLGPKSDINAYTAEFAYPPTMHIAWGAILPGRLQVHNSDLEPSLNSGATYLLELQYVAADDAAAGNPANNCSYQLATVTKPSQAFSVVPQGEVKVGDAAILAWKALDPSVTESHVQLPSNGTYIVDSKATYLGNNLWHYEYAVYNMNASRGARSFTVTIPSGTNVSNVGFHDVDYHDNEPHLNDDWTPTVSAQSVTWVSVLNPDLMSNPLSWGTVYNFRFDADVPPGSKTVVLGQFEQHPGDPAVTSLSAPALAPSRCDNNGICGPGESCGTCPGDCSAQGGGSGCCGDHVCSAGENATTCFVDCGTAAAAEHVCGDSVDNDLDGFVDCLDPDCCTDPACAPFDGDGDHHAAPCDCNDTNAQIWDTPGEVPTITFVGDDPRGPTLYWSIPSGGVSNYDVLRTPALGDFTTDAVCLNTVYLNSATDNEAPTTGGVFGYLVRGVNGCPNGIGSLGTDSSGNPRAGRPCP